MSTSLVLSLAAAVAVLFLLVLALMSRRRDERMVVQQKPLPPMRDSYGGNSPARRVDVALGRELLQLLENDQRPEAIALVRERTGWGPQEASEAVERLDSLRKRVSS